MSEGEWWYARDVSSKARGRLALILSGAWVVAWVLACDVSSITYATKTAPGDGQVWDPQLPLLLESAEQDVVVTAAVYDWIQLWGPGWSAVEFELAASDSTLVICVPGGLEPRTAYRLEFDDGERGVQEAAQGHFNTRGMAFETADESSFSNIRGLGDCLDRVEEAWAAARASTADTGDTAW
ncbi:MAG: hypothetical protein FJ102_14040 [Deltaproteobacteria bacterium]|nr:hypothetical protein [Deltaproteobacteria bacterium]